MEKELSKGEKAILELGLYVAHPINLNVLLTQNERDVLESIRHCINNGENYVSITVLQAMTRLSESSVRRARDSLICLGLIKKEESTTKGTKYKVIYDKLIPMIEALNSIKNPIDRLKEADKLRVYETNINININNNTIKQLENKEIAL
jgi:predicted transcriptional regulator